jgi:hypothetical protein
MAKYNKTRTITVDGFGLAKTKNTLSSFARGSTENTNKNEETTNDEADHKKWLLRPDRRKRSEII